MMNLNKNLESHPVCFNDPIIDGGDMISATLIEKCGSARDIKCLRSFKSENAYEVVKVIKSAIYGEIWYGRKIQLMIDGSSYQYDAESTSVAIKIICRSKLATMTRIHENPLSEIAAMQQIGSHGNIADLIECIGTCDSICVVIQYCNGGDLMDLMKPKVTNKRVCLDESKVRSYFNDLINGVDHLQSHHVCHRDLSLENVMLHDDKCVIIDLGMSIKAAVDHNTKRSLPVTPQGTCGKENYIAPEILQNSHAFDTTKVDTWQLGVILFILAAGIPPMDRASPKDPRYRCISQPNGLQRLVTGWKLNMSPSLVDMISAMLNPNPTARPSIAMIRQMEWMQCHQ